jgi:MurNAc alpha-1-phosphate uridylyltransferase
MNEKNLQHSGSAFSGSGGRAMILAAGLGTRLKPWTDYHPKALAVVSGKSLLQRNIEYLQQYGITNVVVNVHHFADQIIDAIEANQGWGSNIVISDERDEVLETGGGLVKAGFYLKDAGSFVLMNVDILTDLELDKMIAMHRQEKPIATLAVTTRNTSRYFLFDDGNRLCGWRKTSPPAGLLAKNTGEETGMPAIEKEILRHDVQGAVYQKAFSGIHVISADIFDLINRTGKFSMVDVYLDLMQQHTIKSFDHSDSKFIDVGKPESIAKAEKMFS